MIDMARSEPGIRIDYSTLDGNPWLLNVANGTLDLRTGELRPAHRRDLLTKQTSIPYDPEATCARWEQFVREIMNDNIALVDYLKRAVGYSLTGSVEEQCLFFLYGAGANGKSTFLNVLRALFGEAYSMQAIPELLLVR